MTLRLYDALVGTRRNSNGAKEGIAVEQGLTPNRYCASYCAAYQEYGRHSSSQPRMVVNDLPAILILRALVSVAGAEGAAARNHVCSMQQQVHKRVTVGASVIDQCFGAFFRPISRARRHGRDESEFQVG